MRSTISNSSLIGMPASIQCWLVSKYFVCTTSVSLSQCPIDSPL